MKPGSQLCRVISVCVKYDFVCENTSCCDSVSDQVAANQRQKRRGQPKLQVGFILGSERAACLTFVQARICKLSNVA